VARRLSLVAPPLTEVYIGAADLDEGKKQKGFFPNFNIDDPRNYIAISSGYIGGF